MPAPLPAAPAEPVAAEPSLAEVALAALAANPSPAPPPMPVAEAGAPPLPPAPAPAPMMLSAPAATLGPEAAPGGITGSADFRDLKLYQHTANADGSYRHLDMGLTGLVAAAGVWKEVRLKLFDRRGTVGLEFRRIRGWPAMFETWPEGGTDQFGPFWRLETQATAAAMAKLPGLGDRAMLAALLEVLPTLARRAARLAALPAEEQEAWAERGRAMAAAVEASRPEPPRPTGRVG
ncbi:hypothetical protein HEQ75_10965 [Roseomonas sp. BU-1]|uniref:Uncharacterized protein n=1 Tax=Falsiroseomonas selenitidurans TaxID=2716335 RepID=A0ABX1E3U9_9PROT|nr:hypothetical protein [Falsiroseomonas selenitidurans]